MQTFPPVQTGGADRTFTLAGAVRSSEVMTFVDGYVGYSPSGTSILERFFFGRHMVSSAKLPLPGKGTRTAFFANGCPSFSTSPADPRLYPDSGMNCGFLDGHAKFMRRGAHEDMIQQGDGTYIWRYLTADR